MLRTGQLKNIDSLGPFGAGPNSFLLCRTLNYHLANYQQEDKEFVKRLKMMQSYKDAIIMFQKPNTRLKEPRINRQKFNNLQDSQSQRKIALRL